MGEPDQDYINAPETFNPFASDAGYDRCVVYFVAMNSVGEGEPDIEGIVIVFDPDNRYKTYWVDNPRFPFDVSDQGLSGLMRYGPAACTRPTGSQPSP